MTAASIAHAAMLALVLAGPTAALAAGRPRLGWALSGALGAALAGGLFVMLSAGTEWVR